METHSYDLPVTGTWAHRVFAERGITDNTLRQWSVGYTADEDAIAFPYYGYSGELSGVKMRSPERNMWWLRGSKQIPYGDWWRNGNKFRAMFLVEGETDALRLWQELGGRCLVLGLPGAGAWRSSWATRTRSVEHVYLILDNDDPDSRPDDDPERLIEAQKMVETAGARIQAETSARRIILPSGVNDLCDFFGQGGAVGDLRALARHAVSSSVPRVGRERSAPTAAPCPDISTIIPDTGFVREYVDAFEPTTEAPREYHIACALALLSLVCANAWLEVGARVPLSLYALVIGPTTAGRKTTATRRALEVLDSAARRHPFHVPRGVLIPTGTFSPEALVRTLREDGAPKLARFDEFAGFLGAAAQRSYMAGIKDVLMEAANGWLAGRMVMGERIESGPVHLSILASTTNDRLLDELDSSDVTSGFLGRFLLVFCPPGERVLAWPESVPAGRIDMLADELANIANLVQGRVEWTAEARQQIAEWHADRRRYWSAHGDRDLMRPMFLRGDTVARKVAALLQAAATPAAPLLVQEDYTRRATAYVDTTLAHIQREMGGNVLDPVGRAYRRLERVVRENSGADTVTLQSLAGLKPYEFVRMMASLEEAGRVTRSRSGGRSRIHYQRRYY